MHELITRTITDNEVKVKQDVYEWHTFIKNKYTKGDVKLNNEHALAIATDLIRLNTILTDPNGDQQEKVNLYKLLSDELLALDKLLEGNVKRAHAWFALRKGGGAEFEKYSVTGNNKLTKCHPELTNAVTAVTGKQLLTVGQKSENEGSMATESPLPQQPHALLKNPRLLHPPLPHNPSLLAHSNPFVVGTPMTNAVLNALKRPALTSGPTGHKGGKPKNKKSASKKKSKAKPPRK